MAPVRNLPALIGPQNAFFDCLPFSLVGVLSFSTLDWVLLRVGDHKCLNIERILTHTPYRCSPCFPWLICPGFPLKLRPENFKFFVNKSKSNLFVLFRNKKGILNRRRTIQVKNFCQKKFQHNLLKKMMIFPYFNGAHCLLTLACVG